MRTWTASRTSEIKEAIEMSDMADRRFELGKTKSSNRWHIVKSEGRSWCNHQLVDETLRNVPFSQLSTLGESCTVCYTAMTFDAVRGTKRGWDLRRYPKRQRPTIRRLRA